MPSVFDILSLIAPQAAASAAPAPAPATAGGASAFGDVLAGLLSAQAAAAAAQTASRTTTPGAGELASIVVPPQAAGARPEVAVAEGGASPATGQATRPAPAQAVAPEADQADDRDGSPLAGLEAVLAALLAPVQAEIPAQARPQTPAEARSSGEGAPTPARVDAALDAALERAAPAQLDRWADRLQSTMGRLEALGRDLGSGGRSGLEPAALAKAEGFVRGLLDKVRAAQTQTPANSAGQTFAQAVAAASPTTDAIAAPVANSAPAAPAPAAEQAAPVVAAAAETVPPTPEAVATERAAAPVAAPDRKAVKVRIEPAARTLAAVASKGNRHADAPEPLARQPDPDRPAAVAEAAQTDPSAETASRATPSSGGDSPAAPAEARPAPADRRDEAPVAPTPANAAAPAAEAARAARAVAGSPETVAHLAAQIVKRLEGRSTRFDLELHPADLGRVDVQVRIEQDGRLAAQLAFDNPVAAADFRARSDDLRRALEQAGFQVGSDSLSFAEREPQNFSQGGFGRGGGEPGAERRGARARAFDQAAVTARVADAADRLQSGRAVGLDVRV